MNGQSPTSHRPVRTVLREDLKRNPDNGWSLFGLLQCQRAVGRFAEAAETERRFRDAWKYADMTLTAAAP